MRREQILLFFIIFGNINYIYSRLIFPPFFKEDELGHHTWAKRDTKGRCKRSDPIQNNSTSAPTGTNTNNKTLCSEDKLMTFLAEIQVINPESILKIATIEELNAVCRKVNENMEKTQQYLATCTPPHQTDLYLQLIKGVDSLYQKLCVNNDFRKRFETYQKCLKEMSNEFEDCNGPPDWNEDSEPDKICAAYKDIADCYYIKTAKVCGKEAAATMKELMEAIINSILTVNCSKIKAPTVKDAMPEAYIEKTKPKTKTAKPSSSTQLCATSIVGILYVITALCK